MSKLAHVDESEKGIDRAPSDVMSFDTAAWKKITRKVDMFVLPLLFVTYSLQFMDKLALSSAAVFGLRTDNNLHGQDYSWVSSIFYFGYLLGEFPITRMTQVLPLGKLTGILLVLWGMVLAATSSCTSYSGLLAARFFLGVLEAGISPIFVIITATWYGSRDQPLRTGIWFAGNDFGGIISGFIAFGLGHINGGDSAWKYIFIVYGCMTVVWGFVVFFFLPDTPAKARFFTEEEKQIHQQMLVKSPILSHWSWNQLWECVIDPQTWMLVGITVLSILPNGAAISYGYIIVDGFGFTSIETTLLMVPASVITWIAIVLGGYVSTKWKNIRTYVMVATVILPIIGSAVIYSVEEQRGVRLMGYYFMQIQPATFPQVLSLITSNYRGATKRNVATAIIFVVYCACNIGAPQLFIDSEAPRYPTAFETMIICFCLNILMALLLRAYLTYANRQKTSAAGEANQIGDELTDKTDSELLYSL